MIMARTPVRCAVRVHQAGMSFSELLAVWRDADRLDFDGATLYDLLAAPAHECWTALTALTMATRTLRAIPLVLAAPYRHPVLLAKMAATLDEISGGRLILGLGAGGSRGDHERSGLSWDPLAERVSRLEAQVEVIRHVWRGSGAALETRHYGTVTAATDPGPAQRPCPPIVVGGHDERYLLPAAARVADVCNVGFDLSLAEWDRIKHLLARHCEEAGRHPDSVALSHNATVIVAPDTKAVDAKVRRFAQARGLSAIEARERLAHALVGTPEACAGRMRDYVATGVSWFFLLFDDPCDRSSLRLFAREVLPVVRRR